MKNKWRDFKGVQSPAEINKPDLGTSNMLVDWGPRARSPLMRISLNGLALSTYEEKYHSFESEKDIENFFYKEVLKDSKLTALEKKHAVSYLMTAFHQGGLLCPVSSALRNTMRGPNDKGKIEEYATLKDLSTQHDIHIVSTSTGFKVQEICEAKALAVYSTDLEQYVEDPSEGPELKPEAGKDYILKAQGVIAVDFSHGKSERPDLIVESNSIDYGHSAVKQKMDTRTLGQRIVDFFKHHFGLNKVQDISVYQHQEERLDEGLVTRLLR